jgi:hypothetical protein
MNRWILTEMESHNLGYYLWTIIAQYLKCWEFHKQSL